MTSLSKIYDNQIIFKNKTVHFSETSICIINQRFYLTKINFLFLKICFHNAIKRICNILQLLIYLKFNTYPEENIKINTKFII